MARIHVRRSTTDESIFLTDSDTCHGCAGCGVRPSAIRLPQLKGNSAQLEMSAKDQWSMLVNGWVMPLLFVMLATFASSFWSLSDGWAVSLAMLAFCAGLVCCRPLSLNLLNVSEIKQ